MANKRKSYKRVLLKLSGEVFGGAKGLGVYPDVVNDVAKQIADVVRSGVQVAIVVGGGNYFRGAELQQRGMDRARADYMGMLGTVMNCLALQDFLEKEGIDAKALTKRVRAVHAGKRRLELKNFQVVAQATFERKRLHIEHYNRGRNEHTHRDISPQQLVHYRDNWYVDAWCHTREKILNFSVDVITDCKVLDTAAKEVSQKDIKLAMQSGYGSFGGEAKN